MRKSHMLLTSTVAVVGLLIGVFAIDTVKSGQLAVSHAAPASAKDTELLNKALARQGEAGDGQFVDCKLSEALPNFRISWNGGPGERIFEATIDGHVRDARPGSSHRDSVGLDDRLHREDLAFNDKSANWRTVVLSVEVSNDFDPKVEMPSDIEVVLWLDGTTDPEIVLKGFRGQRIFAVLEKPGRLDPLRAYPVARNGSLIGVIAEDGSLSLPGLDGYQDVYLRGLTSISTIERAAEGPATVLPLSTAKGYWERTDCQGAS